MSFKRSRNDGRPNTIPLFGLLDPLPWVDRDDDLAPKRYAVNFSGTLDFNPRMGYDQDQEDYL